MLKSDVQKVLQRALSSFEAGQFDEAARLYSRVLSKDPKNFVALFYLGSIEARRGNLPAASSLMAKAAQLEPRNATVLENYATILFQMGDYNSALAAAERVLQSNQANVYCLYICAISLFKQQRFRESVEVFDKVLSFEPNHLGALNGRGIALSEQGNYAPALASFEQAIAFEARFADAHLNKGVVYAKQKRYEDAFASIDTALGLNPDLVDGWLAFGNIFREQKRYDDAVAAYDKALAINPDHCLLWIGRGNCLFDLGRNDEASAAYDRALALDANVGGAWLGRGNVLQAFKHHNDALAAYDKALALEADLAEAWLGRGNVYASLKRYDEAFSAYDRALELDYDLTNAWIGRGNTFADLRRYDEALFAFDKALALDSDLDDIEGARLHAKMNLCDWGNFTAERDNLLSSIRNGKASTQPFSFLPIAESSEDQFRYTKLWAAKKLPSRNPIWQGERYNHERIRIAYLSGDFRNHAVSYLLAGVFEQHDRKRFETIAVSFGPDSSDEMLTRLKGAFDQFINVGGRGDIEVAKLLRELEIDIAVDLMGYTAHAHTGIFSHRPSPIQVNYLGYPGTMGVSYIDYLIADPTLVPAAHQQYYSEKIASLPDCYMPSDDRGRLVADRAASREETGLPQTRFVYCCFNNSYKLNPTVFDGWMRILKKVEGSVLWLSETNAAATANLRKEADARGISPDRLVFARRLPNMSDHLARHSLADLFLDTRPYNAHTTASDALWAGLPVLTQIGDTFAGRVAASLLNAAGLPELIMQTQEQYENAAVELAVKPEKLEELKGRLLRNRVSTPLFDTKLFTRHIEAAYAAMYERHQAGLPPDHIDIAP